MLMKDYRTNELKWYVWAYVLVLMSTSKPRIATCASDYQFQYFDMLLTSAFFAGAISALAFVFDSLYTERAKRTLLCFGVLPLPGETIFTRISKEKIKDIRFDVNKAQIAYTDIIAGLPSSKKERERYENEKWYSLFRQYKDDPMVKGSHRDFLLSRDLFTATVTLLALTCLGVLSKAVQLNWLPFAYLAVMLGLTGVASHFKASRFVNNVIVADLNANSIANL
ncbi:MAG: hypothetical protein GX181_07830 [Synergistaceae bacterium]|nr:hypothetical protein [Synergistaceae bacterium]